MYINRTVLFLEDLEYECSYFPLESTFQELAKQRESFRVFHTEDNPNFWVLNGVLTLGVHLVDPTPE